MIYLDASALVSLFMADVHSPAVRNYLRAERPVVGVSSFAVVEFASAVARRVRMGELIPAQANHLLNVFDGWTAANAEPLDLEPADVRVATTFVRRFELGLRAPDALHIAICQRLELPLLTFDGHQATAAQELGILLDPLGPSTR